MERKGKCNNVGICSMAGKVQIITDDDAEFVCSDCGEPLEEVTEEVPVSGGTTSGKKLKLPLIIAAAVIVLGGGAAALFLGGGDKNADAPVVEQPVPQEPPMEDPGPTVPGPTVPDGHDLGYAVFQGKLKDGKPHDDNGVLTFKKKHIIESRDVNKREANPGEKVIGIFENGHLVTGTWYKADGNKETLIIGG